MTDKTIFLKGFLKFVIYGFCLLSISLRVDCQNKNHRIEGTLKMDSIWSPTIYLSHIESLNELNTVSNEMIIAESKIDSLGNFTFSTDYLFKEDHLYRIHVSKKNSPAASLIIGGKDENHMFIIANANSDIIIKTQGKIRLFDDPEIIGHSPNQSLIEVNKTFSYKDSTDFGLSKIKRGFITKAINEKLRFIADTSKHSLVSLYALYKSDFESDYPLNKEFYLNYIDKWNNEDSNYFQVFKKQIPAKHEDSRSSFFLITILSFFGGFFLHYLLKNTKNKSRKRMQSLSVQERRILKLIQEGKSNKEISEEYNIELSTVKTHVSNIYSKLNIKSRKEALEVKV